jgi:hypothetical protein
MKRIADLILLGLSYFNSGSVNSEEFNDFFEKFKTSFTNELKKVKATKLQFSKGHFYISGFFTVGEQVMYFSVSDVRSYLTTDWKGTPQMLIRRADNYKDYSGGSNNFVTIEPNMSKKIAQIAGYTDLFEKPKSSVYDKKKVAIKLAKELKETGEAGRRMNSGRQASFLAWRIAEELGIKSLGLQEWKRGRYLVKIVGDKDGYHVYYDADTKRLSLEYSDPKDPSKIQLDDIAKTLRTQNSEETLELLKANKVLLMCWGASNFSTPVKNIFRFNVNGHKHKGFVYITVNASDWYDVYLTTFTNKLVQKLEDISFDELSVKIDEAIETTVVQNN